jgi:sensor histidine kinase YesM
MSRTYDYYIAQAIITEIITFFPLTALVFIAPEKLLNYAFEWLLYTFLLVTTWHLLTRRFIKKMLQNQRFYRALVGLSAIIISSAILYLPSLLLSFMWHQDVDDQKQLITTLTQFNVFLTTIWVIGYISAQAIRERTSLEHTIRKQSLKMLSQQVQPAFLYQCLDNIEHLMDQHTEAASDSITDLAELLRYKLHADKQDVAELSEELNAIGYMQRLANAGDLQVLIENNVSQYAITVPPLLVYNLLYMLNLKVSQPLRVDVSVKNQQCFIRVSGFIYQPRLIINRIKKSHIDFFAEYSSISYQNKVLTLAISL